MVGPTASQVSRRPIPSRPVVQTPLTSKAPNSLDIITLYSVLYTMYYVTYTNTLPWQKRPMNPICISFTHTSTSHCHLGRHHGSCTGFTAASLGSNRHFGLEKNREFADRNLLAVNSSSGMKIFVQSNKNRIVITKHS